jgi:capsular exopolysaccharide synthesis family protein
MSNREQADGVGFEALWGILRRRLGLILAVVAMAAGGALVLSLLEDEKYSSSATLALQVSGSDQLGSPLAATADQREAATNFVIAARDVIARRTAKRLERQREFEVAAAVPSANVSAQGVSDVIKVEATATRPKIAALAANAFADELVAFGRNAERARIRQTQRLVKSELDRLSGAKRRTIAKGATGESGSGSTSSARRIRLLTRRIRSLESRSEDLTILASLQTGNASVIERATPPASPSSPKPIRNTVIGAFAGLLLGLGLAFVREQQDRRVRDSKELEDAFGLPLLARVPESSSLSRRSSVISELPPFEAEGFRMLRANLRYLEPDREVDSVLITSASVQDGKSTVAFHLAATAAATGTRVLLIEADVRRPTLARLLGLPSDEGLTSVLADTESSLAEVSHEVLLAHDADGRGSPPTMDIVVAGQIRPDSSELIESHRMQELIRDAKQHYSLVVIDTPPAGLVSDAIPLMSQVSAVIVVGRMGKLTSKAASGLRDQLEKINAPTVGVVANFAGAENGAYYAAGYELISPRRSRS